MKQSYWKQLKKQICPPQKWILDKQSKKCHCCSKQFIPIFRRRHHCRFCGNLFCSDCSQHFINGNYIQQSKQKYIRNCQFCHKKIQKMIRQWTTMPIIYGQQDEQDKNDQLPNQQQNDQWNLGNLFQQGQKNPTLHSNQILQQNSAKILNKGANILCDKFNLNKEMWEQKLINLAQRAAVQAKMEVLVRDEQMDISKKVKIRTIKTSDSKVFHEMIKGVVLFKNLSSKTMQTQLLTTLTNPKVLIIQNSIDITAIKSTVSFQGLIKNQKFILNKLLQKIISYSPDILFVQNNVHLYALDYLHKNKIFVVNKFKQQQFLQIKHVLGINTCRKIKCKINLIKQGKCDTIYFNKDREGEPMIFIQAEHSGIRTILLGEEKQEVTKNLKKVMKTLLKLAREINLEKHFIMVEKQLKDAINKKQCAFPAVQDFNKVVLESIDSLSLHEEISYTKVLFTSELSTSAVNLVKPAYKEMCGPIEYLTTKKYTNSDITLGAYILLQIANYKKVCKHCLKSYTHKQKYYINDCTVTIITQQLSDVPLQKASSSILISSSQQNFTIQKVANELIQQKQVVVIQASTLCSKCGNKIGHEGVKVQKWFLSNSFHYILFNITMAYNLFLDTQVQQSKQKKQRISQNHTRTSKNLQLCDHSLLIRTYQYLGFSIRIYVQKTIIYMIDYIDLNSSQAKDYIEKLETKFMNTIYQKQLNQQFKIHQRILSKVSSLLNKYFSEIGAFLSHHQGKIYQKYLKEIKNILQKCQQELQQVKSKVSVQKNQMSYDCPQPFFRIVQVQSVLKILFIVVFQIQKYLIKLKAQQMLTISNSQILLGYEQPGQKSQHLDHSIIDVSFLTQHNTDSQPFIQYFNNKSQKVFPKIAITYFLFPQAYTDDPVTLCAVFINICINSEVYHQKINQKCDEIQLKIQYDKQLKTKWSLHLRAQQIHKQVIGKQVMNKVTTFDMTVYYPQQFEKLRKKWGINNDLYIRGLVTCKNWDSTGGKSKSLFAKSQNDLLVVKIINQKQSDQFLKFAKDYIMYLSSEKAGKTTLLAKIFGIYQVSGRSKTFKYIVMQNLNFGLKNIKKVYDLKGAQINRLTLVPQGSRSFTGQDQNYKRDRDGQPYILRSNQYDKMMNSLTHDLEFLKSHQVMDYSMLVIENQNKLRLGIIDYMRPYQLTQKIQNIFKELRHGCNPTVIPPNQYKERFIGAMKRYFLKVL